VTPLRLSQLWGWTNQYAERAAEAHRRAAEAAALSNEPHAVTRHQTDAAYYASQALTHRLALVAAGRLSFSFAEPRA